MNNNDSQAASSTATEASAASQSQQVTSAQDSTTVAAKPASSNGTVTTAQTANASESQASSATETQSTGNEQQSSAATNDDNQDLTATRQVLQNISNTASYRNANSVASLFGTSLVATTAASDTATDTNAVTVTDANGLIDAIQNGTATTINIANDINLGTKVNTNTQYTNTAIKNKRDITIQSATPGTKYTIDFAGYGFNMYDATVGVTFKDLSLYGQSYFGIIRSAGAYNFDNVDYTGSQLVYTDSGYSATVTFKNTVNASSVASYTGPLDNKSRSAQGGGNQQVLQFRNGTNSINFDAGSVVHLSTYGSNVIEIDGGTTTINVNSDNGTNGAQVTLEPHTAVSPESNFMGVDGIGRGIASQGTTTLTIDKGAALNINLTDNSNDTYHSSALYLTQGATINVAGSLNITSDGVPYYRSSGIDDPVYIGGNSKIDVNGGSFIVSATNMGSYQGSVITSAGTSTISINHHGTFSVTGDGTQATGISLASGSTFTSTQPAEFTITMPDGATAGKNGTINFKGVKTSENAQPIGEISVSYASNGTPTVKKIVSADKQTTIDVRDSLTNNKNAVSFIAAGEEVDLKDITFTKDADGNYIMSGNANTAAGDGAYVYISVNGTVHQVATNNNQTLWTIGATGDPISSNDPYTVETGSDGSFSVNLDKLNDSDQVSVYAAKDFVTSDKDTKTVSEWMTDSYRDQLNKLVKEAPTIEDGTNYNDADTNLKTAYTNAISAGSTLLDNTSATSAELEAAVNTITSAKDALNGDTRIADAKQKLQDAVNNESTVEGTSKYYNATKDLQNAYKNAIAAGNTALNAQNPTVESFTAALNAINTAKDALDGKATDTSKLQAAVDNAKTVEASDDYKNASADVQKQYTDAVTAGQKLINQTDPEPTQAEVDAATKAITDAQTALTNSAALNTSKAALKAAVEEAPTVRETPAYYNGTDEAQKAYDDAITTGQQVLDNTNATAEQVKSALDAITTAKGNLKGEATNTDALNTAITNANNAKQTGNYINADRAQQEALTNAINAGQDLLNNSQITQAEVDQVVKNITDAINSLNGDTNLANAKTEATTAIENALAEKTTEITNASDLTTDEKDALTQAAKDAAATAKTKVNQATTNDAATQAGQDGVAAIDAIEVPTESAAKKAAKEAVAQAAQTKNDAIDASNLTDEEKAALKHQVTAAQTAADNAIDAATTNAGVTSAQETGIDNINKITVPSTSDAKTKATTDLNNAVDAAKKAIDQDTNLTEDERNAAKNQIDADAKTAQDAINNAKTDADVTKAINDGQLNIDKTVANAAIDNAVAGKKAEISNAKDLSSDNAAALNDEVDQAAKDAKDAISAATTEDAVKQAQTDGVEKINTIDVATTAAKDKAKSDIDQAANDAKKAIDDNNDLTDNQKQAAKAQIDQDATNAKDNINNAKTAKDAEDANNAGQLAIAKDAAKAAIQGALNKKLTEIDNASALTSDEKDKLTNAANTAATNANNAIDAATTPADVTTAENTGIQNIENVKVPAESATKKAADAAIDEALANKQEEIKNSTLTDEEKAALNKQATDAADKAKQNIADAKTDSDVATAQNNGIAAIDGIKVPSGSATKENAKADITNSADEAKKAIDQDGNLTDEEKQAAKDQIDNDAKNAQEAIDNAKSDDEVKDAVDNGNLAIDKDVANAAIDNAVAGKKNEISNSPLTEEEKTALNDKVDQAAQTAKDAINSATTPEAVTTAQEAGVKNIGNVSVPTTSSAKEAAKKAVAEAADAKNQAIDSSNLTAEEKAALKQKVADAQTATDNAIDSATTNTGVASAQETGIQNINGVTVPSKSDAKEAAKKAVADAANAKNQAIDSSNLTAEEKAALKQKVADAQTAADKAIDSATTNDAVTKAQEDGINNINAIKVPTESATKENAKTDISNSADEAKKAIDQDSNLTDKEKQAAKDQIDTDAKNAQDAIDNAKSDDEVKNAVDNGNLAIDKDVANAAIDNAVAGKKNEISNSPLTDEEKAALNNEVDQAAQTAKDAINNATTPEAVTTAQEAGVNNIDGIKVPTTSLAKTDAIQAIDKALQGKKNAINNATSLTNEEKSSLIDQANSAANAAKTAINDATTNAAVENAKNDGVKAIDSIEIPTASAAKEAAKKDLSDAVTAAKDAIDQDSNLTDEEKQAAKDQIDSDAQTAQNNINNAQTDADVTNALNNGKVAIDKDVANAAIDNAVAGKLKEIQDPLTSDEKKTYTDLINTQANNAKANIASATTQEEVANAQNAGVDAINGINVPTNSTAKDNATAAIDKALQDKTTEINNATNINNQVKADLINQATNAANSAKEAINSATTNADVVTAQTNGEKAIADVTIPSLSDVKKESIDLINKTLDEKKNEINNATNISNDEKQQLINDATNKATEAINNIDQATTNDDARQAANTGIQNIENVTVPSLDVAKNNAKQAIDDALTSKTDEINAATNLTDSEKQSLIDQATDAANTAKENVEKATTNQAAQDAANEGIENIKGVTFTTLDEAKDAANKAIDNALQTKTDEINKATNLSTSEKQDLIDQATEAAQTAKDNINSATTNDAVTEAQNTGIQNIANVTVPSLDEAKKAAIEAIKQVQNAKNKQISEANNLSTEEQKELTDQVDQIANEAIAKINDSSRSTNDAVAETRDDAIKQITDLFIPTLDGAQKDAIQAIETAKNAKIDEVNNATHLSNQEKQDLIDEVNKAADEATKSINNATTNDEVKTAETTGLDNINNIAIPSLAEKQQEAIQELNKARDAKIEAIDNAPVLTNDEKNSLKNQVQTKYSNAVSDITQATTDDTVTAAKDSGIKAINGIENPTYSEAKNQAKTDITNNADEAKKAIDQDSNLTDEEKQAAKDQIDTDAKNAQDAIDNAKTDSDVNTAITDGKVAIDKDVANAAIDNAVAGKKNEISNAPLTEEEKTALNNEVDQAAQTAKDAIKDATTPEAVTTAQEAGVKDINAVEVPSESEAKEAAKKAVADAASAKNQAIDSSNLTDEEKAALKQEVADTQKAVDNAIDSATTNDAVAKAQEAGVKNINGIEIPEKSTTKENAKTDITNSADEAKKAIDQDSNLTDEEKQAAKDQIDTDAKNAQDAIDNAKDDDEVKNAVDNGNLAIDKDVANAAIDNAVAGKKNEISNAPLTEEEKAALNNEVDQAAQTAKDAINNATTPEAVTTAQEDGVKTINNIAVPTTSSTKDEAIKAIDDALTNKVNEIKDATNLSDKQKQDLIGQADKEAAKAKEEIKNATSDEAVNKATEDGVEAIANVTVPSLDDAKKDASQVIDDVLKQKEDEINNASHLTDQEKQDLIKQAQNTADEAKDKINQATTNDDVATERDAGAEKIANIIVPSLDDAKDKATKAIDDALADKTKEINDQTNLSDKEKNDLINQITDIADKAKDKINNDSNDAEVAKDEKDGIDAIVDTKVPGLEDHKQNAIKSLDEAKSTKLAQIDEAAHLTVDEKKGLTQQVDAEYNKALDEINNAATNADADKASAAGVEAILNIVVPSLNEKKQDSIDALNEVREAKKEEINNANNLSQDEKDELTKQVDQIADNAINAINEAKDDQAAKNAETKGIQDILNVKVPSLDEVKTNAKQAIADALESKTNEINAASNLDSATKQGLIDRAKAEADTAIAKIDQATSNDQALAESQAGVDKILGIAVPNLADAKQSAIDAINDALKQKETEINNASQLTSDEKQSIINQVNSIADDAKNAINNAATNQSVDEAKNTGIAKIDAINVPTTSATKDEAIKAIDDALTNKVNEINNATNITAEERANLIAKANNAANTAKDNIVKATSDSEVATATTNGINAIANVTVPSLETAKDQAKDLIDDVLNEKKNEINNAQNLSDGQKQDLINQATDVADQAKKNIDNATTNDDVQTAEDNGAQAIENVAVPSLDNAKKASTKVIDEVLKEKTAEINAATNLSNAEKDALIKDATTAANSAKDNIAKATTNDAVKDAETNGVKAILDIKVPGREDQQKDAVAALDRALADKVSEINNANNLSETTKQDLKQQAQAAYTTAVDNVNNAQTNAEINTARDNGVQAILDVAVPTLTDAQDSSITAVEQVRDAKKTQIEAAKNLTETQKEALKNQVDKIADKAIDNIKKATTDGYC
ncbi:DUF1542 domain-containing protein [uncultured Limosilactobacillus sp.]|uniref:DUF1542 domain-containing protein n=1 Tax=uncultured Limosilactobacillus sp. TaxID=2837629 RepID=UPI00265F28DF|nr:DUF1542 domain-containing protein [uncultured Limosilactobacillus sp.]